MPIAINAIKSPIRFRNSSWHSVESGFEPCKDDFLSPDVAEIVADIQQLGFIILGNWNYSGFSRGAGRLTLLEHPQTLDAAKVLISSFGPVRHLISLFQTRFEDGTEINTVNSPISSGMPPLPGQTVLWLPEVRDVKQLYRIHTQVIEGQRISKKKIPVGPDPINYLSEGRNRLLAHFVETAAITSLMRLTGLYRPTWKGALLAWPGSISGQCVRSIKLGDGDRAGNSSASWAFTSIPVDRFKMKKAPGKNSGALCKRAQDADSVAQEPIRWLLVRRWQRGKRLWSRFSAGGGSCW